MNYVTTNIRIPEEDYLKCLLVTADKRFVEKINLQFVKLLEEYK